MSHLSMLLSYRARVHGGRRQNSKLNIQQSILHAENWHEGVVDNKKTRGKTNYSIMEGPCGLGCQIGVDRNLPGIFE